MDGKKVCDTGYEREREPRSMMGVLTTHAMCNRHFVRKAMTTAGNACEEAPASASGSAPPLLTAGGAGGGAGAGATAGAGDTADVEFSAGAATADSAASPDGALRRRQRFAFGGAESLAHGTGSTRE